MLPDIEVFAKMIITIIFVLLIIIIGFVSLAVLTTWIFLQYPPLIFDSISKIGIYHRLVRSEELIGGESKFGETRREKIWLVFKHNFWIAFPLFFTLLFLLSTFSGSQAISAANSLNSTVNSSNFIPQNSTNQNLINIPLFIALSLTPTFLLSMRILANPSWNGAITYDKGIFSNFSSALTFFGNWIQRKKIPEESITCSDEERARKIRSYKEQVISFYFSFVGSSLILLLLFVFLQIEVSHGTYDFFASFFPMMNPVATIMLFLGEIPAILIVTIIGELYLEWAEPIDQI